MLARQLVIAPAARDDLKEIYQYGLRLWDKAQSDSYLISIKEQLWALIEHPLMGSPCPERLSDTRSLPIQRFTLFYQVTANQVEVIHILHSRQGPQYHLKYFNSILSVDRKTKVHTVF